MVLLGQNDTKSHLLDKFSLTPPFLCFLMSSIYSSHLSSIWNFKKTEKDLQLSVEIIAGSMFILSTANVLYYICISENMWHNHIECFNKDKAFNNRTTSKKRAGRAKPLQAVRTKVLISAFVAVKEALVPGFLVSTNSGNYTHDLR